MIIPMKEYVLVEIQKQAETKSGIIVTGNKADSTGLVISNGSDLVLDIGDKVIYRNSLFERKEDDNIYKIIHYKDILAKLI